MKSIFVYFLLCVPLSSIGQEIDDIPIKLAITEGKYASELKSYARREIESLSHVKIVEEGHEHTISFLCSDDVRYVCSVTVKSPVPEIVAKNYPFIAEWEIFEDQILATNSDLRLLVQKTIAIIDGKWIEAERTYREKILSRQIKQTQYHLKQLGYHPGVLDGVWGAKTREAVRKYQTDRGLPADQQYTRSLAERIELDYVKGLN